MKGNKKKGPNIPDLKEFNTKRILGEEFRPIPLNLKLLSNPFLKDQEKFHYIIFRLNDYNRRISQETAKDPY